MMKMMKRYGVDILGLGVMAMGITMMIQSGAGTSPISSCPNVLAVAFPNISLGTFTMILNGLLIVGQLLILGRHFPLYQLLQIPLTILFGLFVDGFSLLMAALPVGSMLLRYVWLVLGTGILALGVALTVMADVAMNSGEAFVKAVTIRWHKPFGNCKVAFDLGLVLLACVVSWLLMGRIVAVREGTIFAAAVTGLLVRVITRRFQGMKQWLEA